ncbi:Y-family DNA polymerase [uncultured Muribaculum sp.]|uniref:Y-family DNA polymerase n=2 Tax=uncultured Muribaculum sp. TaxID=1918613 RepID=UPI0025AFA846|nr:Y-family DNA polymerase [uncultured Muribaculum sp.]
MIVHIDCNSFFVSCERAFRPDLRHKPVVVLSNNDGCVCSMSTEAKLLGIKRGDPYFKFKELARTQNITCFSGNHKLYNDMSSRVMDTLRSIATNVEVYSVDDAFIKADTSMPLIEYGNFIKKKIWQDTCIPVSVGIAETKTLSKIASHFAKRYKAYNGVAVIDTTEKAKKAMSLLPIENIWGIGRKLTIRLRQLGIKTALQFAEMPQTMIHQILNITGERTWRELNGERCIPYEREATGKQSITASRSFAKDIYDIEYLSEAISVFAAIVSRRLRRQHGKCTELYVFLETNRFHNDTPYMCKTERTSFEEATSDTLEITSAANNALKRIYKNGIGFKRAGIVVTNIVTGNTWQMGLFTDKLKRKRSICLMETIDKINAMNHATELIHVAAVTNRGVDRYVRNENKSRLYTTDINDIITVKAT